MTELDYYLRYGSTSSTSIYPFSDNYISQEKFKHMVERIFLNDLKIEKKIEEIQEDKVEEEVFFNPENLDI